MSKSNAKDLERRREIVARFKLVDDTFFELVMQDKEVCEEVLRVILEDEKLKVLEVIPQKSIKNLQGRAVRLDAHCILGNGEFLEDGLHEVYVNTKIDDGSDIARLMKCFEQETVQDEKFPKLSARVMQFKAEEEEVHEVCSLVEDYAKDYAKEYAKDYAKEYVKEYVKDKAMNMIRDGLSDEKIAQYLDLTVEEVKTLRNKEGKD